MSRMKDRLTESYHNGHTEPCESDFMTEEELKKAMEQAIDDEAQALEDKAVQSQIDKRKNK